MKDKKPSPIRIAVLIFLTGLLVFFVFIVLAYLRVRAELKQALDPAVLTRSLSSDPALSVARVGELLLLPDEEPLVITITDSQKLASQSEFYRGSIDGDSLLLFQEAGKAVIYSPTRDILVNVGPLVISDLGEVVEASDTP